MPYSDEDIEAIVDAILGAAGIDSSDLKEADYEHICATARDAIFSEFPDEQPERSKDPRR